MNLNSLSDKILLERMDALTKKEREVLIEVLHHLREIDRRVLFSALGFQSLFQYAIKRLGYSEDQAYRRINAMRALKTLPQLEEKIQAGTITLTNLSLAQSFFRAEAKSFSKEQKMEVIAKLENKSTREAEKVVLALTTNPKGLARDTIKQVRETMIEVKFVGPERIRNKLDHLKGLLAHKHPLISMAELVEKLCDLGLEEWNPGREPKRRRKELVKASEGVPH